MSKKAQVQIELEEGGKILSPFSQLVILQHLDWHHSFEIRLPMRVFTGDADSFAAACEKIIGKPLKIGLQSLTGDKESDDNFFKGIITDISMSRSHGASNQVVLKGFSPTILLEDGPNTRSFSEMKLSQIVEEVLAPYPQNILKSKVDTQPGPFPYVVQYQESNYHFLSRMAQRYGEWFYYDGTTLNFAKPEGSEEANLVLGKDLINFDLGLKLSPSSFNLKAHDYFKDETYESPSSSANVEGLNSLGDFLARTSEDVYNQTPLHDSRSYMAEKSELDDLAKRRKSFGAAEYVTLSGVSDSIKVKIGSVINITASWGDILNKSNEDHKKYVVIGVSHRIDGDGNYQNHFEAIPASLNIPPRNPHIKKVAADAQTAVVVENHDPDKLGRIRVKFYWQEDPEMTPWIRVLMPHAGGANGAFFMPEVDEEVMVDFFHSNPDRPFVAGAVYHINTKPADEWQDSDNNVKGIKTKSGNEIRLTDKPGGEEIKIFNPDSKNEIVMTLSGSGSISITSKGDISISADKSMSLTANEISINAEKKITVGCEELEVSSQKNTSFSAGQEYALDSGTKLALSSGTDMTLTAGTNFETSAGANAKIAATANAEVTANANMDVKGNAMVNVQAGGIVSVSGATVKLN